MSIELKGIRIKGDEDGKNSYSPSAHEQHDNPGYEGEENRDTRSPGDVAVVVSDEISPDDKLSDHSDDDDDVTPNACSKAVEKVQHSVHGCYKDNKATIWLAIYVVLLILYFVYFGYALYYHFGDEGSVRLLWVTCLVAIILLLNLISTVAKVPLDRLWTQIKPVFKKRAFKRTRNVIKWLLAIAVFVFLVVYIIIYVALEHPENLIALAGLAVTIIIFYITSTNPAKVRWHPVFWGISLQYIFALLILQTDVGYTAFSWAGDRVTELLNYASVGAQFVFSETHHIFAFVVLPIVVFFYAFISILFYVGLMQFITRWVGRFLAFCMGTTPAESLNAAGNIFVGMTESPLLIRPFLKDMTKSELHAVMTGGFATIAGSVLGAYISFGVPANHLLSASVMSAPAALAISKLTCPETERSKASSRDFYRMEKSPERNIIEAASNGATNSVKLVAAVAVNVMAFLSLLAFVNATLTWFGDRVGVNDPPLTLELICSYVFWPIAYLMGTEVGDCRKVAELIGLKTFTNEFIAYERLAELIGNGKNYTEYLATFNSSYPDYNTIAPYWNKTNLILPLWNQTLKGGVLSEKSTIISTYALCGFANFGSIGILLGGLGVLVPSKKKVLVKIVIRAMIAGNVACFLTACIAGMFYRPPG